MDFIPAYLAWIMPIIRTWAHILIGIGALLFGFVALGELVVWARNIERGNDIIRKLQRRSPDQWKP